MVTRRAFLASLAAGITLGGCALHATQRPDRGSIAGYLLRRGIRFGRKDMRVPNTPIILHKWVQQESAPHLWHIKVVDKQRTDAIGRYEFKNLTPGLYYIQPLDGLMFPLNISGPELKWVNLFQHPPNSLRAN